MTGVRTATRRVLSRTLSVGDVLEIGLWLLIPYVLIGLGWAFFHVEEVRQLEDLLQTHVPAGGGMGAYLLVGALWPVYVLLPSVCMV